MFNISTKVFFLVNYTKNLQYPQWNLYVTNKALVNKIITIQFDGRVVGEPRVDWVGPLHLPLQASSKTRRREGTMTQDPKKNKKQKKHLQQWKNLRIDWLSRYFGFKWSGGDWSKSSKCHPRFFHRCTCTYNTHVFYQVFCGRVSCFEEGNGLSWLRGRI